MLAPLLAVITSKSKLL